MDTTFHDEWRGGYAAGVAAVIAALNAVPSYPDEWQDDLILQVDDVIEALSKFEGLDIKPYFNPRPVTPETFPVGTRIKPRREGEPAGTVDDWQGSRIMRIVYDDGTSSIGGVDSSLERL